MCESLHQTTKAMNQGSERTAGGAWKARFDALMKKMRRGVPRKMSPQEIEGAITDAHAEVRERHRARRS
jgi:hypothetical protein